VRAREGTAKAAARTPRGHRRERSASVGTVDEHRTRSGPTCESDRAPAHDIAYVGEPRSERRPPSAPGPACSACREVRDRARPSLSTAEVRRPAHQRDPSRSSVVFACAADDLRRQGAIRLVDRARTDRPREVTGSARRSAGRGRFSIGARVSTPREGPRRGASARQSEPPSCRCPACACVARCSRLAASTAPVRARRRPSMP
jgi:hypothetical protein